MSKTNKIDFKLRSCISDLNYLIQKTELTEAQKEMMISINADLKLIKLILDQQKKLVNVVEHVV